MKRGEQGFSLPEILVAIVILTFGVLSVSQMFVYAIRRVAASADIGKAGAAAAKRMENLRATPFASLTAGTSFSDTTDPAVIVNWSIVNDLGGAPLKTISVTATARRQLSGPAKKVTLMTMRAK
jgi:prepilin-type N-terminal cleavage/methylation domain-containing protein